MTHTMGDLAKAIEALAVEAGAVILRYYLAGVVEPETKADGSPVTAADRDAEALILRHLAELTPDIPVIAEEQVSLGHSAPVDGPRFWLVDPLDGTREVLNRNGEFTVNIALIDGGVPVLGTVHAPALGTTYVGGDGIGATKMAGADVSTAIEARLPPSDGLAVVSSRSHGNRGDIDAYLARFPVSSDRPIGSSLKFGILAAGEADLYPRLSPTMEWDVAAGHAVLRAAGGRVDTIDGEPMTYGKPGFRNPFFVAYGRR